MVFNGYLFSDMAFESNGYGNRLQTATAGVARAASVISAAKLPADVTFVISGTDATHTDVTFVISATNVAC